MYYVFVGGDIQLPPEFHEFPEEISATRFIQETLQSRARDGLSLDSFTLIRGQKLKLSGVCVPNIVIAST